MSSNKQYTLTQTPLSKVFSSCPFSLFFFLLFSLLPLSVFAGSLDSPAAVTNSGSAMYSLESVYNRLATGATGTKRTTTFSEPGAGPGATGHTLDEVMSKAPVSDNGNGATTGDVVTGKTFWSLQSGNWGLNTGTANPAPVPQTGQNLCYNTAGSVIACAGTGQDGDLKKGIAHASPRFSDNSDGTVTDNSTGLIWLKNANCFGTHNFATALTDANTLANGACGLSDGSSAGDWRLPNVKELHSLIDFQRVNPALPTGHPFASVQSSWYWSSTTYVGLPGDAWSVDLGDGVVGNDVKTGNDYVWPVRGGQ